MHKQELKIIALTALIIAFASIGQFITQGRDYVLKYAQYSKIPILFSHTTIQVMLLVIFFSLVYMATKALMMYRKL